MLEILGVLLLEGINTELENIGDLLDFGSRAIFINNTRYTHITNTF